MSLFTFQNWKRKTFHKHDSRNGEIDFVLSYLPDISWTAARSICVLDVGCCESLLIHELKKRGYTTAGIDIRNYDYEIPKEVVFYKGDITNPSTVSVFGDIKFYYIVALSTIEHIGLNCYGSKIIPNGDRLAVENIHTLLCPEGYFIITVPMYHWRSNSGRGYSYKAFLELIKGLFQIVTITQKGGQICAVLAKL